MQHQPAQYANAIETEVQFDVRKLNTRDLRPTASVIMDGLVGKMAQDPSRFSRFGYAAVDEGRKEYEGIMHSALVWATASGPKQPRPSRVVGRGTPGDIPGVIAHHTVLASHPRTDVLVMKWIVELRETQGATNDTD